MEPSTKYDAFISYTHADAYIAETLHKKIERYHIPHIIQQLTGKKKFERVFRDKDELSLSSDLTQKVYDALDSSEFLIVICSLESKKSMWVPKEVEYFLKNHDKDHILVVLLNGDPNEVFPPVLLEGTEPLAADIRAYSQKESLKKLNSEFLRLVAAMLDIPYDLLKQRHRAYIVKRAIAIVTVIAIVVVSFSTYSYIQRINLQIQEEESALNESTSSLEKGFREDALNSILSLDGYSSLTSNTTFALNNALYSYKAGWAELAPERTLNVSNIQKEWISNDGKQCYAIDKDDQGYIVSLETGEVEWELDSKEIDGNRIAAILPYEEHTFLVVGDYLCNICDGKTNKIVKSFALEHSLINMESYCIKDNVFAVASGTNLAIYNLEEGKCIRDIDLRNYSGTEENFNYQNIDISFDKTGNKIIIGSSCYSDYDVQINTLQVYDIKNNEFTTLSNDQTVSVYILDNGNVAAIQKSQSKKESYAYFDNNNYYLGIYDLDSNEQISKKAQLTCSESSHVGMLQNDTILLEWIGNQLVIADSQTGECLSQIGYDSDIIDVHYINNQKFLVTTQDGWIQRISITDTIARFDCMNLKSKINKASFYMNESLYDDGKMVVLINGKPVLLSVTKDSNLKQVEETKTVKSIEYLENETNTYRLVNLNDAYLGHPTEIALYKVNSDECIYRYSCEENHSIYDVQLSGENLYICELNSSEVDSIHKINIETKEETDIDLSKLQASYSSTFFNSDFTKLVYYDDSSLIQYDISDTGLKNKKVVVNNISYTSDFLDSLDEIYFQDYNDKAYLYDMNEEKIIETEFNDYIYREAIAQEKDEFLVVTDDTIYIIDATNGNVLKTIQLSLSSSDYSTANCAFFNHDESILVSTGNNISLYDIDSGDILDSYTFTTQDEVFNKDPNSLNIITSESSDYFALKDESVSANSQIHSNRQVLLIFTVDKNNKIRPYAEVSHGYTSIDAQEVAVRSGNDFYYSSYYGQQTLFERAKEIVNN